jgi:transcriptional regulator with XRE-family HTH domain
MNKRPHLWLVVSSTGRKRERDMPPGWDRFPGRLKIAFLELAETYPKPDRCQNQIADLCGVNRGSFSKWLSDPPTAWENITYITLHKLACGLGVELDWLISGRGPKRIQNTGAAVQDSC